MKKWERIAAAVLTLIGAGAALEAWNLGLGDFHQPGPGFFPLWLSLILAFVSFLYLLTRMGADPQPVALWTKKTWFRPTLAAGIMLAFANLLGWLGFFSSTFFLFVVWLILIEREKWLTIGLVSVLGTLCLYLVFTLFLKIPLPKGILF
jgi:putative tricarboxylic transport membrane protein